MVCPAVPGSKIGGVAEAVRRAIDFCLSQDAFLSHAGEPAKDKLTEAVSARLSRSQIDKLDSLAADNAAQLERLASAGGRRGPQRYRGGLIRAAIDLYLTRSPEAKKAAADYARKSRHERSVTSPLEETANVNAPSTVSPRKSKEAKHSSH